MTTTRRSFDPAPLLEVAAGRLERPTGAAVAELLGVTRRNVVRWRTGQQGLTRVGADRLAVRLGLHPLLLWPDYYDEAAA